MSPTCRRHVAKSWPTLRVVATQKRPRHTQFMSITANKYKSVQTYELATFLCLSSNNNHEITDMSGIPRHVVKCRVVLDTLPTRHFLVSATWPATCRDMSPTRHRIMPFGQQKRHADIRHSWLRSCLAAWCYWRCSVAYWGGSKAPRNGVAVGAALQYSSLVGNSTTTRVAVGETVHECGRLVLPAHDRAEQAVI